MTNLTDTQLLMYLDGEADAELVGKIRESEELQVRVRELARLQNQLKTPLYRYLCPDTQELVEHRLGLLTSERAKSIENHLSECPHCRREISDLNVFMARETPLATIKKLVARLVSTITEIDEQSTAPAYGVRGSTGNILTYEVEGVQISVDVQDDSDNPGYKVLVGLIIGMNAENYVAQLWLDNDQLAEVQVDDLGNFLITGIYPGEYEMIIRGPEVEVHLQKLQI